jgi:hypothetical protein
VLSSITLFVDERGNMETTRIEDIHPYVLMLRRDNTERCNVARRIGIWCEKSHASICGCMILDACCFTLDDLDG